MLDVAIPPDSRSHDKFKLLVERAQQAPPISIAVAHPCNDVSLESAVEAAKLKLVTPILVGPPQRIRQGA